jgi:DNA (cytosine-5)-methyltransferase 1
MTHFKFVDLFAGIGGTRHAFEQEGGKCVFTCEIDEDAQDVYERNWGDPVSEQDIRDIEPECVPDHDVLLACWPCPSFSRMGERTALSDERGALFYEIIDILEAKQPNAFLLENVKNLRFIGDGAAFRIVVDALEEAGYEIYCETLNALDFGLPQNRERLIIVGFREDLDSEDFEIPTEKSGAVLDTEWKQRGALTLLLEDDPDQCYYAGEDIQRKRRESVDDPNEVPRPSIWHENRAGQVKPRPYSAALRAEGSWRYIMINGERNPTIRELLRLQGFPDWFEISNSNRSRARKLTGNTVPVPMVHECAKAMLANLEFCDIPREGASTSEFKSLNKKTRC